MALSNTERQKRYRERRRLEEPEPIIRYRKPQDRRSRPQRWQEAVETLREIQGEYQDWLDNLPEMQQGSTLEEKLQAICDLDIDAVAVEDFPRGFGRD